jgi:hypothetical protein
MFVMGTAGYGAKPHWPSGCSVAAGQAECLMHGRYGIAAIELSCDTTRWPTTTQQQSPPACVRRGAWELARRVRARQEDATW